MTFVISLRMSHENKFGIHKLNQFSFLEKGRKLNLMYWDQWGKKKEYQER